MIVWLCKESTDRNIEPYTLFTVWTKRPSMRSTLSGAHFFSDEPGTDELSSALYDFDKVFPGIVPEESLFACIPLSVQQIEKGFTVKRLTEQEAISCKEPSNEL